MWQRTFCVQQKIQLLEFEINIEFIKLKMIKYSFSESFTLNLQIFLFVNLEDHIKEE